MEMIRAPKQRGEWVEAKFLARAAAEGLTVSKPWGDSARYDFIVEHQGVLRRVQVKSTTARDPRRLQMPVYGIRDRSVFRKRN